MGEGQPHQRCRWEKDSRIRGADGMQGTSARACVCGVWGGGALHREERRVDVRTSKLHGREEGTHATKVLAAPPVLAAVVREHALVLRLSRAVISVAARERGEGGELLEERDAPAARGGQRGRADGRRRCIEGNIAWTYASRHLAAIYRHRLQG